MRIYSSMAGDTYCNVHNALYPVPSRPGRFPVEALVQLKEPSDCVSKIIEAGILQEISLGGQQRPTWYGDNLQLGFAAVRSSWP